MRIIPDLQALKRRPEPKEQQIAVVEPMEPSIPKGLKIASEVSWRAILVVAGIALVVWGIQQTSSVMLPVAFALLLTSILEPIVKMLHGKLRLNRYFSAAVALLSGIAIISALVGYAGQQLVLGIAGVLSQTSNALGQIQNWLSTGPFQLGAEQINQYIEQGQAWLTSNVGSLTSGALAVGSTATNFIAGLVIALIVTFFFLGDGPTIWAWCVRLLPRGNRHQVHNAARRGWTTLGAYVRTQMLVAGIDAIGIGLGAAVLGLPLVVPLSLIVFLFSFIPMVGAFISGALVVLVALVTQGLVDALIMLGIVLLVQQIEGNVLQPVLMSKSVSLHPLATLLGVAAASYLVGIVGAVFVVPLMAFVNVFILYLRGHDKFPEMGQQSVPFASYERNLEEQDGSTAATMWTDPASIADHIEDEMAQEERSSEVTAQAAVTDVEEPRKRPQS